jgi:hypothetical protein
MCTLFQIENGQAALGPHAIEDLEKIYQVMCGVLIHLEGTALSTHKNTQMRSVYFTTSLFKCHVEYSSEYNLKIV